MHCVSILFAASQGQYHKQDWTFTQLRLTLLNYMQTYGTLNIKRNLNKRLCRCYFFNVSTYNLFPFFNSLANVTSVLCFLDLFFFPLFKFVLVLLICKCVSHIACLFFIITKLKND